ncbi:MAG TPA: TAT-variant-translocated molybdopterin oxidoreductase, partial [Thermoanaerobaculia bacterium]
MAEEKHYWQSLEELGGDPAFLARRGQELPSGQTLWEAAREAAAGESRRDFLKLMGFSLAAATVASCSPIPERRALPLVQQPEELIPGLSTYYATTCGGCSAGCGLLVKTRDGRPIKIEGNPDSPLTGGGTCAVGQGTVLGMYDDQRQKEPLWCGEPTSWESIDESVGERLSAVTARKGGIALLTGTILSPSTLQLIDDWKRRYPGTRHVVYDPVS